LAVLLLQGPLGSFYQHLASALSQEGETVYRIVFNGGDEWFTGRAETVIHFQDQAEGWPAFLANVIQQYNIKLVLAYGDCRYYHLQAKRECQRQNVRYFAFEEGYLRPNYITLEEGGVNGHSPITHKGIEAYQPVHTVRDEQHIPKNFLQRVYFAVVYYNVAAFKRRCFSRYIHHRSFSPVYEAGCWIRAAWRKALYKLIQPSAKTVINSGEFFLVPLQVHNDAQIEFHSQYTSMTAFIEDVLASFAIHSPEHVQLVFKHHPMDRGHVHYGKTIKKLTKHYGLEGRVQYIHDQHLPTLLKHTLGIVTINSTTALQAFYHGAPVKVMGDAYFDMPGLTDQQLLASFWKDPLPPNDVFADQFRGYLLDHGQLNGSFYCKANMTVTHIIEHLKKANAL